MGRRSLRLNLILWFTSIFALILALSDYVTYRVLHKVLIAELDSSLVSIAAEHGVALREGAPLEVSDVLPDEITPHFIQLISAAGDVIDQNGLSNSGPVLTRAQREAVLAGKTTTGEVATGNITRRIAAIRSELDGKPVIVVIGTGTQNLRNTASRIAIILLSIDLAAVAASVIGGYLIIGRALRPIDHITDRAREIGEGDLRRRLEYVDSSSEMMHLTSVLNEMLDKLQRLFESQKQFIQDAAHEIRSPLAALRCRLEVALRQKRQTDDYRRVIEGALEDAGRLTTLADDLFLLARADSNNLVLDLREVLVSDVAAAVHSQLKPVAEAKHVEFSLTVLSDCMVYADRERLHQAFRNLAENALKYTPAGGNVRMTVTTEADEAKFSVEDTGIGIPLTEQSRVFTRFYRVDRARSRSEGGTGLGLAITDQVIRAHHGRIEIESEPGRGTRFDVYLASARSLVELKPGAQAKTGVPSF
jgi:heavy metal sensor kinase